MFNVRELDSSKIRLGSIFLDEFISQISAKMNGLKLKDMINYLSAESSEELYISQDEEWYYSEDSEEKINRITKDIESLEVNRLYDYKPLRQAPKIKNYYPKPTYADL